MRPIKLITIIILLLTLGLSCDIENPIDKDDENIYTVTRQVDIPDNIYSLSWKFDLGTNSDFEEGDKITEFKIYVGFVDGNTNAICYIDPNDTALYPEFKVEVALSPIDQNNFELDSLNHTVFFPYGITSSHYLCIWMVIANQITGEVDTVGQIETEPYSLKIIQYYYDSRSVPSYDYKYRNFYSSLSYQNLNNIRIFKKNDSLPDSDNQNGIPYIQILGLDQYDENGNRNPDGIMDFHNEEVYDTTNDLIIFPSRTPFAENDTAFYFDNGVPVYLEDQVPKCLAHTLKENPEYRTHNSGSIWYHRNAKSQHPH